MVMNSSSATGESKASELRQFARPFSRAEDASSTTVPANRRPGVPPFQKTFLIRQIALDKTPIAFYSEKHNSTVSECDEREE